MTDIADGRRTRLHTRLDRIHRAAAQLEAGTHGLTAEELAAQLAGWLRLEADTLATIAPIVDVLADVIDRHGGPEPLRDTFGTRLPATHAEAASFADDLADHVLGAAL